MAGWPTEVCSSRASAAAGSSGLAPNIRSRRSRAEDRARGCRRTRPWPPRTTGSASVQARAHARVLRTLAGEQERDLGARVTAPSAGRADARDPARGARRRRTPTSAATTARRYRHPGAPDRERAGHIREIGGCVDGKSIGQLLGSPVEGLRRLRAQGQDPSGHRDGRQAPAGPAGRLLEHDVGVRAPEPERADARPARLVGRVSSRRSSVFTKNGLDGKSICGFGCAVVEARRDLLVMQRQRRLDHARRRRPPHRGGRCSTSASRSRSTGAGSVCRRKACVSAATSIGSPSERRRCRAPRRSRCCRRRRRRPPAPRR